MSLSILRTAASLGLNAGPALALSVGDLVTVGPDGTARRASPLEQAIGYVVRPPNANGNAVISVGPLPTYGAGQVIGLTNFPPARTRAQRAARRKAGQA